MAVFWIKIIAFIGVLAIFFGFSSDRLRKLIFRKGRKDDE